MVCGVIGFSLSNAEQSFAKALTFILLLHQHQVYRLESVEVLDSQVQLRHARNVVQREESFARKIIRRYNIVIHYREPYHGALLCALLQRYHAELEAFVEDGIQSFLVKG